MNTSTKAAAGTIAGDEKEKKHEQEKEVQWQLWHAAEAAAVLAKYPHLFLVSFLPLFAL